MTDATFRSLKEFDTGLGPDGLPALGRVTVEFRGRLVRYQIADAFSTTDFRCDDGMILAGPCTGRYDAARKILIWNGNEYERVR